MEELIHKNIDSTHIIIIDEVHERDIYIDLKLALIKWYFELNPKFDIKIILMSTTIAERSFPNYLRDINGKEAPVIKMHENIHNIRQFYLENIFNNLKVDKHVTDKLKKK